MSIFKPMIIRWIIFVVPAIVGTADGVVGPNLKNEIVPSISTTVSSQDGRNRPHNYKILKDEIKYTGWRQIIRRTVLAPPRPHHGEKVIEFDIIDQSKSRNDLENSSRAVIVFAWNSSTKTATLIREYMPACHRILNGLAAGIVEGDKHEDDLVAARFELEEECHLGGGTWHRLTEEGISVPMDKYVVTEVTPYLVIDPCHVPDPRPLDDEEDIEIIHGVTEEEIRQMIREGDMNLVSAWACLLALDRLRELGEIK
mmetsp:Transcript_27142/g.54881  ORF Transcript_27142/g.54881 Transcript_27142/m.54881 type:complete len:256 (+) Transcript_27142:71-838(+)